MHKKFIAMTEKFIGSFDGCGTNPTGRSNVIVSLTSFPARISHIHTALFSLLNQSMKPEMIILWLAEEEFPEKENSLPQKVLQLQKNGLTIRWTKNIGSFKKLIPSLKEFGDKIIVTADDDIFYPPEWLEGLYKEYKRAFDNKDSYLYAYRVHRVRLSHDAMILPYNLWVHSINVDTALYSNFPTTGGGVLYPPNCLHPDVFKEDLFMQLTPKADDIFFWVMAIRKGTKIKGILNSNCQNIIDLDIAGPKLFDTNKLAVGGNDSQLEAIINYYPDILTILQKENIEKLYELRARFNSGNYWNERYQSGGNSGCGSYSHLRDFKASVINQFIAENNINSIIDFGVGDGSLLSQLAISKYTGVDVSSYIIEQLKEKFSFHTEKNFLTIQEYDNQTAEVSMSIDVIFHLVEDNVFHTYMERLFDAATQNIIIYSSNTETFYEEAVHVKHRKFSKWIATHRPEWTCIKYIQNDYPAATPQNYDVTKQSFCDFYFYAKKEKFL